MQTVDRFAAFDKNGKLYVVVVRQDWIDTRTTDGRNGTPAATEYRLASGQAVKQTGADTYQVIASGIELTRR